MPRIIEPQYSPDDYIDGLRVKGTGKPDASGKPYRTTQPVKQFDNGHGRPIAWLLCGVALGIILTAVCSAPFRSSEPGATASSEPTVKETVVEYRDLPDQFPTVCKEALAGVSEYLDSAAAITSANNAQIDIMSEAYTAILMKDWKKLNELSNRQRGLEKSLTEDTVKVMIPRVDLQRKIEQCLRIAKEYQPQA